MITALDRHKFNGAIVILPGRRLLSHPGQRLYCSNAAPQSRRPNPDRTQERERWFVLKSREGRNKGDVKWSDQLPCSLEGLLPLLLTQSNLSFLVTRKRRCLWHAALVASK